MSLKQIIDELAIPLDLPWSEDLSRHDYAAALSKVEEALVTNPEDLRARLWWVQCQAEVGGVPPTALSAPLEEILPRLKEEHHLYEGSILAFLRVSQKLLDRKQTKLAVILLERADEFASKGRSLAVESRVAIRQTLLTTLKSERERAETRRESKNYLDSLDKRIAAVTSEQIEVKPETPRKPTVKLSAKSIMEQALSERSDSDVPPELVAAVHHEDKTRNTRQAVLISLLGGLMIILGLIFSKLIGQTEAPIEDRLAVNRIPSGFPPIMLPEITYLERSSSLDTVTKRLEKIRKDEPPAQQLTWATPEPTPIPTPRELTTEERRKLPEMDPGKLSTAVVQSLGESPARNPVPNIVRGPDGRNYGPPPGDAKALDGSKLEPVEVVQLKEPRLYRVIASTSVFSSPSVVAESVARLEREAKVQVVAKMGKWLEIRSNGGRRGYIYSQDAEALK